jgi:hypothetical protein
MGWEMKRPFAPSGPLIRRIKLSRCKKLRDKRDKRDKSPVGGLSGIPQLLNDFTLIAQGDREVIEAVMRVVHHDVPENWLTANLDHRLRLDFGFFG